MAYIMKKLRDASCLRKREKIGQVAEEIISQKHKEQIQMWTDCKLMLRLKIKCGTVRKRTENELGNNEADSNREFGKEKKFPQRWCLRS